MFSLSQRDINSTSVTSHLHEKRGAIGETVNAGVIVWEIFNVFFIARSIDQFTISTQDVDTIERMIAQMVGSDVVVTFESADHFRETLVIRTGFKERPALSALIVKMKVFAQGLYASYLSQTRTRLDGKRTPAKVDADLTAREVEEHDLWLKIQSRNGDRRRVVERIVAKKMEGPFSIEKYVASFEAQDDQVNTYLAWLRDQIDKWSTLDAADDSDALTHYEADWFTYFAIFSRLSSECRGRLSLKLTA